MKQLRNLGSACSQFILPIKSLQKIKKDRKYKLLDVGAVNKILKDYLPENIEYYSLDYFGEHDYIWDLDKFPLPIKNNKFDIIVCLETLEHTMYPAKVLKELIRIAKPDALFFLSMPNEYNIYCRINYLFARKTDVQEPFMVVEHHHHIHQPRAKDILRLFSSFFLIERIDYQWHSRMQSRGGLWKILIPLNWIINFLSKIYPSLFARVVVVRARKKQLKNPVLH